MKKNNSRRASFTHGENSAATATAILCLCFSRALVSGESGASWDQGQDSDLAGLDVQTKRMTNECVMHSVERGQRPSRLIRLVNKARVNLTTKTPSLLLQPPASSVWEKLKGCREPP